MTILRSIGSPCTGKQWAALWAALIASNAPAALADFNADMGAGLDNTAFSYTAYQDGALAPVLVQGQGVGGDDAVRFGGLGSTFNTSKEHGVYFDVTGPGTLSFQWAVSSEGISGGIGAYLYYQLAGATSVNPQFISGEQAFAPVQLQLAAGTTTVYLFYLRSANSSPGGSSDAGWVDQLVWTPAGGSDTTPDPFSFSAQIDIPISSVATSGGVTVAGIDAATDIAITNCSGTNCQFNVNNGPWTSTATTISNGDVVRVRQISSPNYAATTSLTLDIGGVSGSFDVTTEDAPLPPPPPVPVVEGNTPTGTGIARAFVEASDPDSGCVVSNAEFLASPAPPPEGVSLPHGLFAFEASGCQSDFSVNVTVEYPAEIPAGAAYWKYSEASGWFTIPASMRGNTVSFVLNDNGPGDLDPADGSIRDPGGLGLGTATSADLAPQVIPTLPQWALGVLAALVAISGLFSRRRQAVAQR